MKLRRPVALLLALIMVVSMVPMHAHAEEVASGTCGENLTWMLDEAGILIISGSGAMMDYGDAGDAPWFSNSSIDPANDVVKVVVGENVTRIGDYAFSGLYSLTSVNLPSGLISIGRDAFGNDSALTEITLPDTVESIGQSPFMGCALAEITLPAAVSYLGPYVFTASGIGEATFQGNAPTFDENAFLGITATMYYPKGNPTWTEDVFQDYGGTITWTAYDPCAISHNYVDGVCVVCSLPEGLVYTEIAGTNGDILAITEYTGSAETLIIPERIGSGTVGAIYAHFNNCANLKNLFIPYTVQLLDPNILFDCNLENVYYAGSQAEWETLSSGCSADYVHYNCAATDITSHWIEGETVSAKCDVSGYVPYTCKCGYRKNVITDDPIGHNYANGVCTVCALSEDMVYADMGEKIFITGYTGDEESLIIPETINGYNVVMIDNSAFNNCTTLKNIYIPGSITNISPTAFSGCDLENVYYGGSNFNNNYLPAADYIHYNCAPEDMAAHWVESETVPANCTTGAYTPYTCKCGYDKKVFVSEPNDQHTWVGGTCTTPATCSACGATDSNVAGHNYVDGVCSVCSLPEGLQYFYDSSENWMEITAYTGTAETLVIPESIEGIPINSNLGKYLVLTNCTTLKNLYLPSHITSIDSHCFTGVELENFYYGGSSLNYVPTADYVHYNCAPEDMAAHWVEGEAVPETCTAAGYVPYTCKCGYEKKEYFGEPGEHNYVDGVCTVCSVPDGLQYEVGGAGGILITGYTGSAETLIIPETINGIGGIEIESGAFNNCTTLKNIYIPSSVYGIAWDTFTNCDIENVYFGGSQATWENLYSSQAAQYVHYYCTPEDVEPHWVALETVPATCTTGAYVPYACKCGHEKSVTIGEPNDQHTWADATCSAPQTCTACGETTGEINPDGHSFTNGSCEYCGLIRGECGDNLTWTFADGTLTISGVGRMYDYGSISDVPWHQFDSLIQTVVIENGVTSIGSYAFGYDYSNITNVIIPDSVTSIGVSSFYGCAGLVTLTLPDSITSIGGDAFRSCDGLTSIAIPDGVTSIPYNAFMFCSGLTSITIPDSVTSIGSCAFYGCTGLAALTLPDSITSIEQSAFDDCPELWHVFYAGSEEQWNAISISYYNDLLNNVSHCYNAVGAEMVESTVQTCTGETVQCIRCSNCGENDQGIDSDGHKFMDEACEYCGLPGGQCGDDVYWILEDGTLTISGTGDMQYYAYYPWYNLRETIQNVVIEKGVTNISSTAFYGCTSLTSVTIPDSVTRIVSDAFSGCTSLTSITIPDSVISIGESVFRNCTSLASVTIPDSVTSVGSQAFSGCSSLTSIAIPSSVTAIGDSTFNNCTALTSITIPDSVTGIGCWVFSGCTSLSSITIPDSVTTIDIYAFDNCPELWHVVYAGAEEKWNTISINYGNDPLKNASRCYNAAGAELIEATAQTCVGGTVQCIQCSNCGINNQSIDANGHKMTGVTCELCGFVGGQCGDDVYWTLEDGTLTISGTGEMVTQRNQYNEIIQPWNTVSDQINTVVIEEGVTRISASAFVCCSGLTDITIPSSIQSIGGFAFDFCDNLINVYITDPSAWCRISFEGSNNNPAWLGERLHILDEEGNEVTEVTLDDSVTVIPEYAFHNCTNLENITIPEGIASIGSQAFDGCNSLTEITIPESVTSIGSSAFANCVNLVEITIPEAVTSIGYSAFNGCGSLTKINIPSGVSVIEYGAFYGCSSLKNIVIPNGVVTIQGAAFYKCSSLESITIPASVTQIGSDAFTGCSPEDVYYGADAKELSKLGVTFPTSRVHSFCEDPQNHWQEILHEPECVHNGFLEHSCACGFYYETDIVPATGHNPVKMMPLAPTCEEPGFTDGRYCDICNNVLVPQHEIPARGHIPVKDPERLPTCTEDGYTQGTYCAVCDTVITAQEIIPATGHTPVTDSAVAPTCITAGKSEGSHCATCGEILTAQEVIPATGHTAVAIPAIAPTCTQPGQTDGSYCSVCSADILRPYQLPARGHYPVKDYAIAATCTETGLTEGTHCAICDEVIVAQEIVPATGHTPVTDPAVEPGCATTGKTEGSHCGVCGQILTAQQILPALGHTVVTDPAVAPTCTQSGKTDGTRCSACDTILSGQHEIPALGHVPVTDEKKDPTCEESGKSDGSHCTVCGYVIAAQQVIPATGHGYENYVCTVCGDIDLKTIQENINQSQATPAQIRAAVRAVPTEAMKLAMTTDENNSDVVAELAELENAAGGEVEILVGEEFTEFSQDQISIVGANLNEPAGSGNIKLLVDVPQEENTIPEDISSVIAVRFSMTLENVEDPGNLAVPVKITIPVPAGMNPETLVIVHYHAGGTEVLQPTVRVEDGVLYASFVLDKFSDFAISEIWENPCGGNHSWQEANCNTPKTCSVCAITDGAALGHSWQDATCCAPKTCERCNATEGNAVLDAHEYVEGLCLHCGQYGGYLNGNIQWRLLNGVLSIMGTGNIPDYDDVYDVPWMKYYNLIQEVEVKPGITSIGNKAFMSCKAIEKVTLPEGITRIGQRAFSGCTALEEMPLPQSLLNIDQFAFWSCPNYDPIIIPEHVAVVGEGAFGSAEREYIRFTGSAPELYETTFKDFTGTVIYPAGNSSWNNIILSNHGGNIIWLADCCMDGHTWLTADCTHAKRCVSCGITEGDPLGHAEVIIPSVDPTCITNGLSEGKYCGTCGTTIVAQQSVLAKGHTEVIDKAVAATCTTVGKTEGKHCADCNAVLVAQQAVPAKGHADGNSNGFCDICNEKLCTKHKEETIPGKAATCAENGLTDGKRCKICGDILTAQQTISAKGHTEVADKAVAASCIAAGKTEGKHCSVCNAVLVAQQTVPAKGHTEVKDAAVAATCTTAGKTEGKHCSVCSTVLIAQQTIPAKGHTAVPDAAVAATCTKPGKTSGSHCKTCGTVIMAQVEIPATGHSWKNATCTAPKTCATCGTTSGSALGHNWLDGNCTTPKTCKVCGTKDGGAVHAYDSQYDYKCNSCGITRTVDMTRPMVDMFRMYDPNSGEHFYTGSMEERENLVAVGWQYEGVGFTFPLTTGKPVHRLYDPITGEHLYTMDVEEMNALLAAGWNYEGIAFNSGFENEVPQYRLHNPNASRGAYHFTASIEERDTLISLGWEYQGIGWYSLGG